MPRLAVAFSYGLVKWFLLAAIVVVGVVMTTVAALTRYSVFIVQHPIKFAFESVLFGVMGAAPIFLISKHRDALGLSTGIDFGILAVKFILFWILLELSGCNATFFRPKHE